MEGYEVKEIARIQRIPAGTVKSRLLRGREKMKENEYIKEVLDV